MVIKKTNYQKVFLSETDHEDISHHGSPDYKPFQTTSKEDEKLRKEITEKFSLNTGQNKHGEKTEFGFDGKQQYKFTFWQDLEIRNKVYRNPEISTEYFSKIQIIKAGNKNDLENLCDMEEFLLEKGFEKVG